MLDVERFFDEFGDRYTESIRRSNPCYDAMLASAFEALPEGFVPRSILELGCGTGNLTLLLRERWPEAAITANDVSAEALAVF
jgi:trans-aconitate methyltransferase